MRILQINLSANFGSTGVIAEGINTLARKQGAETYIAWGIIASPSSSKLIHIGNKLVYYEHELESRLVDGQGNGSRLSTLFFLRKIKALRPSIVHLHNIHGSYINYRLLFSFLKKNNIPVVWTFHDCWPFTGHCAYFSLFGCTKWMEWCNHCPQQRCYPPCYLFDLSSHNFANKKKAFTSIDNLTIVSVSKWLNDLVSHSFLKDKRHITIHNGIDTKVFSPSPNRNGMRAKLNVKDDENLLLGVASNWSERKGLNDFLKLHNCLSPKFKIVLVGLTKDQIITLPEGIIGIERTESQKMLADYYSAADIVLNLSREETFGLTTVEGFSCGTPGIGYSCTATPELFSRDTGYIVSPGDIHGLVNSINAICQKGKKSYSTTCRNHALAHFRQEDRFQNYIDLYKQILHK